MLGQSLDSTISLLPRGASRGKQRPLVVEIQQ